MAMPLRVSKKWHLGRDWKALYFQTERRGVKLLTYEADESSAKSEDAERQRRPNMHRTMIQCGICALQKLPKAVLFGSL